MIRWVGRQDWLPVGYFKRVWILLYPWLLYEGISTLVMGCYAFFLMVTNPLAFGSIENIISYTNQMLEKIYADYIPLSVVICLLTIPLLILFMRMDRKKEIRLNMKAEIWEKLPPVTYIWPLLTGVSVCVILNHVLMYSGLYDLLSDSFEDTAEILYSGSFWLEIIAVGILTPITEELIFRGLIYRRLRWSTEARFAIPASAFIFAVFHGNLLQGIYAFCIGLLLAFVYERYHHLAAPAAIHIGANIISVVLTDGGILDFLYEADHERDFILFTLAMMAVFVAAFYIILTRIKPVRNDEKQAPSPIQMKEN